MRSARHRLPLTTIVAYSLPAAPLQFMTFLVSLYFLKYSTDVLGLPPAFAGVVLGLSRVWDAVSDPLAGYWSDRTQTAFGRRRPWLLASCLPLGLGFAAVWSPPAMSEDALRVWMTLATIFYFTAYSVAFVPHLALGAELTLDYHERSRLSTGRGISELLGIATATAAIGFLASNLKTSAEAARVATEQLALLFAGVSSALIVLHVLRVRERREFQGRAAHSPTKAIRDVAANPHSRILLLVVFIEALSLGFLGALFPFMADLRNPDVNQGVVIGVLIAAALVSVPLWLALSRRLGKHATWMTSIAAKAVGFSLLFIGPSNLTIAMFAPPILIGAGQAGSTMLPTSIQADVIDFDEWATGERKEGSYFAAWNLATKLASAVAVGGSGWLLQASGYQSSAAGQSLSNLQAFQFLGTAVPFALHVVALLLLFQFRLTPDEHARIRSEIDSRSGSVTLNDPERV